MIDIEADVFDMAARAVLESYPDAFTTSEDTPVPASFPAVSVKESDNAEASSTHDTSGEELYANVTYDVNIYSNLTAGGAAKRQARDIARIIDSVMREKNFTRTFMQPVQNLADTSVYRLTARYVATVRHDATVFRR